MNRSFDKQRFKLYLRMGLAYLLLFLFVELVRYPETFLVRAVNTMWRTIYITGINLLFFEYALPYVRFTWKRIVFLPLFIFAILMLCSFGLYAWRATGIFLNIHTSLKTYASMSDALSAQASTGVFSVFFFGIIKHIHDYRQLTKTTQELRIQKQEAELNYLKAQTNPHFLFNTLNNIYSLARDKSDLAPESILRLSKILRFMLYETSGNYIAIEKELQIITDYIALERLRYDETLRVNFNHDVEDMKQALPPLLLMPLVENAFKHGVSETRNQPFIDIHLSLKDRQLSFFVKNSTEAFAPQGELKENIGLSNLRRQLELLYTDYDLSVKQADSVFTAALKINLGSHV
jgi:two-component system, LytTR family, sensor kinase